MITNYDKQIALQNIGYDVDNLEKMSGSALTRLWLDEIGRADLIHWAKEKGEYDGVCHVLWLDGTLFNGACHIAAYKTVLTDILALYAGEDMTGADSLSVLAASEDDTAQLFVDITDFDTDVIDRIYDYAMNYK